MIDINLMSAIAQWSSLVTIIVILFALRYLYLTVKKFGEDRFRSLLLRKFIFLTIVFLGVSFMCYYHFTESGPAEDVWYISIFLSLIVSIYNSYETLRFSRGILNPLRSRKK